MRTARTTFEEDEDEITRHEDDREVTLSSTTVLLIFFGLVLVCGLCFGLGYSLGHRSTPEGAESAPVTQAPLVASTSSGQPKPSAAAVTPAPVSNTPSSSVADTADTSVSSSSASDNADTEKPAAHETAPSPQPASKPVATAPKPAVAQPQVKPALAQTTQTTQATPPPSRPTLIPAATSTSAPATPSATSAGTIMVQVAAISNPTDAQVLVGALRKRGYSASVHNQASDNLLHIQVGPFATRAEAATMKQKLLSDGYNAILK